MTTADLTESQFLSRFASLDAGRDGAPDQGVLVESSFFPLKESLERLCGFVLLVAALPVMALLVVLVRLNSRGPGIFRQTRVGKRGLIFTMYKLRSMRVDAESQTGPAWSPSGGDPRTTKLGYWLRRLHLDELPQLWNVVRGEMSLVGPRPERPEFVHLLAEEVPGYLNRLVVQPGITGLAQINLPPDTDLDSVRRKLALDCEYIRTANWWLDVRIVLCTALRVLWIKGPVITRMLGLERMVPPLKHSAGKLREHDADSPVSLAALTSQPAEALVRHGGAPHSAAPSNGNRSTAAGETASHTATSSHL
jgi:lipopolysaccharide/colanic/teichoic acid biosynthesis glycosyltransferase